MNKQAVRGLIAFGVVFVAVAIYGIWLLIFGGLSQVPLSEPVFTGTFDKVSPIANNSIRFFNGRNFAEFNLKDGSTRKLLPSDGIYPSTKVIAWSNDATEVILQTGFHTDKDVFAQVRTQQGVANQDQVLWHLDLELQKYTALPVGYQAAGFTQGENTLLLLESIESSEAAHAENPRISGYSLTSNSIAWSATISDLPTGVVAFENRTVLQTKDQVSGQTVLYRVSGGSVQKIETPINAREIVVGPNGYTVYEQGGEGQERTEGGVGQITVYDTNFGVQYAVPGVGGDYGLGEVGSTSYMSYLEGDVVILEEYSRETGETLKRVVGDANDDQPTTFVLDRFQQATASDVIFARSARSLRYVGEDPNFTLTSDATRVDFDTAADSLDSLNYLSASGGTRSVNLVLFAPLNSSRFAEIDSRISSTGIDPNLVPVFISAEY